MFNLQKFEMKKKSYLNYCIVLISILLMIGLVMSQSTNGLTDNELKKELDKLKTEGQLSDTIVKNIDKLTTSQKDLIMSQFSSLSDKEKFWAQWNDLSADNKKNLIKSSSLPSKQIFFRELGKYYGVSFKGFAENFEKNVGFEVGGIIGNDKIYFNAEEIKKLNSGTDSDKKIKEVELKKEAEKTVISYTKENGGSAKLIVGEDQLGYYMDVSNNKFYKLKDSGKNDGTTDFDEKSTFTGNWNGKGQLTIDSSDKKTKISMDYNRDSKGQVGNINDFASFTNGKGETYSAFQKPSGKYDNKGNEIYLDNKAEVTFSEDGKPVLISDSYIANDKYKGFFGKDVNVLYSKAEYDAMSKDAKSKLGSYFIMDEKTGYIGGDVNRGKSGLVGIAKEDSNNIINYFTKEAVQLNKIQEGVDLALAGKGKQTGWMESIRAGIVTAAGEFGYTPEYYISKGINDNLGIKLSEDSFIVQALATRLSLSTTKNVLDYAQSYLSVGTATAGLLSYGLDTVNYPFLAAAVPSEGSYLELDINNEFAKSLNNVEFKGRFSIEDSQGKEVNVISSATPYSYTLNPNFNKDGVSFEGINFNLVNQNVPEQKIQIVSDSNGNLEADGISNEAVSKIGSISASTTVSIAGPRGKVRGGGSDGLFYAEMSSNTDSFTKAKEALDQSAADHNSLMESYTAENKKNGIDGFTSEQLKNLNDLRNGMTAQYWKAIGDSQFNFELDSISQTRPQEFGNVINQITYQLDSFANSPSTQTQNPDTSNPALNQLLAMTIEGVMNDYTLQDQLAQRGLSSSSSIETAAKKQVSEISEFLRNNNGNSIQFISDNQNKIYQLKYGSETLNLDPAIGGITSKVLPMILGSGGIDNNGNFYIDNYVRNNRFSSDRTIVVSAGEQVQPLRGNLRNIKGFIQSETARITGSVKEQIKSSIIDQIRTPGTSE